MSLVAQKNSSIDSKLKIIKLKRCLDARKFNETLNFHMTEALCKNLHWKLPERRMHLCALESQIHTYFKSNMHSLGKYKERQKNSRNARTGNASQRIIPETMISPRDPIFF